MSILKTILLVCLLLVGCDKDKQENDPTEGGIESCEGLDQGTPAGEEVVEPEAGSQAGEEVVEPEAGSQAGEEVVEPEAGSQAGEEVVEDTEE